MDPQFDPYRDWLGLPPSPQPRNFYQLLELAPFEERTELIGTAANKAMSLVRKQRPGPHAREWSALLDELAQAKDCLSAPERKRMYDDQLRRGASAETAAAMSSARTPGGPSPLAGDNPRLPPGMSAPSPGANPAMFPPTKPVTPSPSRPSASPFLYPPQTKATSDTADWEPRTAAANAAAGTPTPSPNFAPGMPAPPPPPSAAPMQPVASYNAPTPPYGVSPQSPAPNPMLAAQATYAAPAPAPMPAAPSPMAYGANAGYPAASSAPAPQAWAQPAAPAHDPYAAAMQGYAQQPAPNYPAAPANPGYDPNNPYGAAGYAQQQAYAAPAYSPQGYPAAPAPAGYGQQGYAAPAPQSYAQPDYGQQAAYGQQPGYAQQPAYPQQPAYNQQPAYGQQPNYAQPQPAPTNYGQPAYDAHAYAAPAPMPGPAPLAGPDPMAPFGATPATSPSGFAAPIPAAPSFASFAPANAYGAAPQSAFDPMAPVGGGAVGGMATWGATEISSAPSYVPPASEPVVPRGKAVTATPPAAPTKSESANKPGPAVDSASATAPLNEKPPLILYGGIGAVVLVVLVAIIFNASRKPEERPPVAGGGAHKPAVAPEFPPVTTEKKPTPGPVAPMTTDPMAMPEKMSPETMNPGVEPMPGPAPMPEVPPTTPMGTDPVTPPGPGPDPVKPPEPAPMPTPPEPAPMQTPGTPIPVPPLPGPTPTPPMPAPMPMPGPNVSLPVPKPMAIDVTMTPDSIQGAAEVIALIEALTKAREAINKREYAVAKDELQKASALAKLPVQKQTIERQRLLIECVEQFWSAVAEGMKGLNATDELQISKTLKIAVVEVDGEKIVVRVTGENQTYQRMQLKAGIARAIGTRWLDDNHPSSQLFEAAFMIAEPNLAKTPVKDLLAQAAKGGDAEVAKVAQLLEPALAEKFDSPTLTGPPLPEPTAVAVTPMPGPTPEPMPGPKPTAQEVAELAKTLQKARDLLAARQLDDAKAEIEKAEKLAKTPEHQAMVARLDLLEQYVTLFWKGVGDGLRGMQAGDTIDVKGNPVSLVEVGSDFMIIRATGRNIRYTRADFPGGIAMAVAQKTMDSDPRNAVTRGAFYAVEPKADRAIARGLFEEGGRGGVEVKELLKVLDDDYNSLKP